jgi:type IV pilus assembly protein PilO
MNALRKFFEDLQKLDMRDVGRWPLVFRALAIGIAFVAATGLLVWYFVFSEAQGNVPQLRKAEAEQQSLWQTFDDKQRRAANLEAYRLQLAEIERTFGAMLRQLPGRTEVPSLLVDISQAGLAAGLQENLFQPGAEVRRDFYAELPIKIRLTGGYHEFGEFVSGVAALPRIVTLHDIQISPATGRGGGARRGAAAPPAAQLTLDLTAKTYRYLEESELAEQEAAAKRPTNRRAKEGSK